MARRDLPLTGDCFDRRCPSRTILAHVTGRWGSLVIAALRDAGVLRFSELRDRIEGISEKMLSQTLRDLEGDALLVRTSRPVVPPHVEYRLSDVGAEAAEHVFALVRWIETHVVDLVPELRDHGVHFGDGRAASLKPRRGTSPSARPQG